MIEGQPMAVFGTALAFYGLDCLPALPPPQSLAPSPRTIQRRGESESPDPSGILRSRRQITALHFRAPVLWSGCRATDGRDRGQVVGDRAAHGIVHRHGVGAAIV